jgi:RluA family pseudouridine synthase
MGAMGQSPARLTLVPPDYIELSKGQRIPILYEDSAVLAIDKPRKWMLVPSDWKKSSRNLQAALISSIAAGAPWAQARGVKYLHLVHRLDAETTGVLLFAKSPEAVTIYSELFQQRKLEKDYLAVVHGLPEGREWVCRLSLAKDLDHTGRVQVDPERGRAAETRFRVLQTREKATLLEAHPVTGRTHQIRVHLAASGHPLLGDALYGPPQGRKRVNLALRAVGLAYADPHTQRRVEIRASAEEFLHDYGFDIATP